MSKLRTGIVVVTGLVALLSLALPAQVVMTWDKTYGDALHDLGHDVLLLDGGGYFLLAETLDQFEPVMLGHALLMRLDSDGNVLWEKTYGGERASSGQSMLPTDDGGCIIVGTIQSDDGDDAEIYLLRVDADGNEIWSRTFGTALDEYGGRLLRTADGGYVIAGNAVDPDDVVADPGAAGYSGFAGRSNVFLVRTDAEGHEIWSKRYVTTDNVLASGAALADGDGIVVLSYIIRYPIDDNDIRLFQVNADGDEVWSRTWEDGKASGYDMIPTSDGGFLISGIRSYPDDPSRMKADGMLIKVDAEGGEEWLVTYGEPDMVDTAHAVLETADGRYICVGWRERDLNTWTDDILVAAFGPDGTLLWEDVTRSYAHNLHEGFLEAPDGSLIIAGSASRPGRSFRIQLLKMTPEEG